MPAGMICTRRLNLMLLTLLAVAACTTLPELDTAGVNAGLTPARVVTDPQRWVGSKVLWGGAILEITNLKDSTRLEVLSHPLDGNMRPKPGARTQGRFVVEQSGYLEPATYAPDRLLTVVGIVSGTETRDIGAATAMRPVVESTQLYLWPGTERGWDGSSVHFGVGVGVSF
jgi:outer membrane lipoprotein